MEPSEFERVEVDVPQMPSSIFLLKDEHAYGIEVEGDSMIPTLYPKWKIIVMPERPRSLSLAVVGLTDGQRLIKRARYDHAYVILESSNPVYEPLVVALTEIEFIHRIAWIKPSQAPLADGG